MNENSILKQTRSASADEYDICNRLMGTTPAEGFSRVGRNVENTNNAMKGDNLKHIAAATNPTVPTQRTSQDGWTQSHFSNAKLDAFIACWPQILLVKSGLDLFSESQQNLNMDLCTRRDCDHCVGEPERRIIRGPNNTEPLPPPRSFKRRFIVSEKLFQCP
jgi:hypothetical protein